MRREGDDHSDDGNVDHLIQVNAEGDFAKTDQSTVTDLTSGGEVAVQLGICSDLRPQSNLPWSLIYIQV
jgi:hypothetical protein